MEAPSADTPRQRSGGRGRARVAGGGDAAPRSQPRLAYTPMQPAFTTWKGYRGGLASVIWIADLSDSRIEKIPHTDSNDFQPMWVGKRVYFLSDRNGPVTLFAYEPGAQEVTPVLDTNGADVLSASAGPDYIAYETLGALHTFDLKSGKSRPLDVRVTADLPGTRPRYEKVAKSVRNARLSPTGVRVVVEMVAPSNTCGYGGQAKSAIRCGRLDQPCSTILSSRCTAWGAAGAVLP